MWWVIGYDYSMRDAPYVPLHCIIAESLLSTSFSAIFLSANETVGLPGWSMVEHMNWFKILVLRFTYHLGGIKESKNNNYK